MFIDNDLADDKSTRRSQTEVLIFLKKAPILWYIKRQANSKGSNFGAYFCAMKSGVEMAETLRYKIKMFGLPIYGSANMFCDNKVLYKNTITPESVLKKKHHYISYHRFRDEVDDKTIRVDN